MVSPIRVNDIMSSPVRTAGKDTLASEAAEECYQKDIGSLVVVEERAVVGVVTMTDLVGVLGSASDPGARPLHSIMSTPVITVSPEIPVTEALVKMKENNIARVVVTEDSEPVGVVSTDDVVRYVPQIFHRHELDVVPEPPDGESQDSVHPEIAYENGDWEFEHSGISSDQISVGDRVQFSKSISEQDVRTFAAISGDTNRLHLDQEYAKQTRFRRRIAHGTLVSGLISAALARLPGLTIYLSQDLSFHAPVDIGDRVTAVCEVAGTVGRNKYELTTDVYSGDEQVIEGQATVLIDFVTERSEVETKAEA